MLSKFKLTDWSTKAIQAIWKFSCTLWKARCDWVHGKIGTKSTLARRRELITLIWDELERTVSHAEYTTKQLRSNVQKSIGNTKVAALEIWLEMLRNAKSEIFNKKQNENIRTTRAQPITIFFEGWRARREYYNFIFTHIFHDHDTKPLRII